MAASSAELTVFPAKKVLVPGSWFRVNVRFRDLAGDPVAPLSGELTFRVAYPDGTVQVETLGAGIQSGPSGFFFEYQVQAQGTHRVRVESVGTVQAAAEYEFQGDESAFYTSIPRLITEPLGPADEGDVVQYIDGRWQPAAAGGTILGMGLPLEEGAAAYGGEPAALGFPYFWHQRRFAIIPDLDRSGNPVNAALNSSRIATACNVRDGGWVYTGEGTIAVNNIVMGGARSGVTLTGPERGMRRGGFVDTPWKTQAGVQFQCYDLVNPFLTMCDEGMAGHFEVWYPNQSRGAVAPVVYPPTFDVSFFGCTIRDCTVVNPYELMRVRVAGVQVEKIYSFPINRGIWLQRMPDCARIHDVHFNPNLGLGVSGGGEAAIGSAALAHALAVGDAFVIDGAEGYSFTDCFCGGYRRGLNITDMDADGFHGASGIWHGGGWDQCFFPIYIDPAQAIGLTGIVVTSAGIIPYAGGTGIYFGDTWAPGVAALRPRVECHGCLFDSPGGDIGVHMPAASYGVCRIIGGIMQNITIGALNNSPNAFLNLAGVTSVASSVPTRVDGSSGNIVDSDGLIL